MCSDWGRKSETLEGTHGNTRRIWNLRKEMPLVPRVLNQECVRYIITERILKFQKNREWFAIACVEKFEERVRLSNPVQWSYFHDHFCCEMCSVNGCQNCNISTKVRDEMKERLTHAPQGVVLHIRTFNDTATRTVTSRACIADWAFEDSAGKEDPVGRKDITDLPVEQSREIQHKEPSSGRQKWRTLKSMTPSPPLLLMWERRNNMKIIKSEFEARKLPQSQKGICYLCLASECSVSGIWHESEVYAIIQNWPAYGSPITCPRSVWRWRWSDSRALGQVWTYSWTWCPEQERNF